MRAAAAAMTALRKRFKKVNLPGEFRHKSKQILTSHTISASLDDVTLYHKENKQSPCAFIMQFISNGRLTCIRSY